MGSPFGVRVTRLDLVRGYYEPWRSVCEPNHWYVDASYFATPNVGAFSILSPTGRLVTVPFYDRTGAPEHEGIVEACRMIKPGRPTVLWTDQLSHSAIWMNPDRTHAVRLSRAQTLWAELFEAASGKDIDLRWVRGHGRHSNAGMAVVDQASRKGARLAAAILPDRVTTLIGADVPAHLEDNTVKGSE